ncbi:hypothetical protein QCA50_019261 [Cerrena zonata]|uniref:DUF6534 domain-containing protein n=2 Tax=Cerrena zonata TaxID=2478898 RepID=A0AAW0FHT7_9APHY
MASFESTLAGVLGGYIEGLGVGMVLYGIAMAQAYVYLLNSRRDPKWLRFTACTVVLVETAQVACLLRELYVYSVIAIANPLTITQIDWSVTVAVFLGFVTQNIVDCYYIYRVWSFSRNLYLTIPLAIIPIARDGFYLRCIAGLIQFPVWTALETTQSIRTSLLVTISTSLALNVLLAASMVYYLRRNTTAFERTRNVLSWMILYSVHTGGILALVLACALATYLLLPSSLIFTAFILINSELNSNAFFGLLNAKNRLRQKMNDPIMIASNELSDQSASYRLRTIEIGVTKETSHAADDISPGPSPQGNKLKGSFFQ